MRITWLILLPLGGFLTLRAQSNLPPAASDAESRPEAVAAETAHPAPTATNSPAITNAAPAPDPAPAPRTTEIYSDSANFDLKSRIAVYVGNVRVIDPQMKLVCGILTAHLPESGKIDSIVAEDEVVIDAEDNRGKPIHATGDRAVYSFRIVNGVTNEPVELTGKPATFEDRNGSVTAETITWDRISGTFSASGGRPRTIVRSQAGQTQLFPAPATNSSAQSEPEVE